MIDAILSRKESALQLLSALGFVDAEDPGAPSEIYHPSIGTIDTQNIKAGEVVQAIYAIGVRRGEENIRCGVLKLLGIQR